MVSQLVSWSVSHLIYYATSNLGWMHSWKSGGVDFDGFIGGLKDYSCVFVGVIIVVSVFVKREAGSNAREGGQERCNAMRKGLCNEIGGRSKRWAE